MLWYLRDIITSTKSPSEQEIKAAALITQYITTLFFSININDFRFFLFLLKDMFDMVDIVDLCVGLRGKFDEVSSFDLVDVVDVVDVVDKRWECDEIVAIRLENDALFCPAWDAKVVCSWYLSTNFL